MPDLELMPHQDKALTLTENFNRCAYYLDMGLGKTFVGAEKLYLLNNTVNLVICQKSKIDDWVQHFKEYYPDYHVLNLRKKSEVVTFRNELSATTKQLIGVVNYETAFRRDWLLAASRISPARRSAMVRSLRAREYAVSQRRARV